MQLMLTFLTSVLFIQTTQFNIRDDNFRPENCLIKDSTIFIHNSTKYLLYRLNIYTLSYIINSHESLLEPCSNDSPILNDLSREITLNMRWNVPNPINIKNFTYMHLKSFTPNLDRELEDNINEFNINTNVNASCRTLTKVTHNFKRLNTALNRLYNRNGSAVLEIIPAGEFKRDIYDILESSFRKKLEINFEFQENFLATFFDFTRFSFFNENYNVSLLFEIPLFTRNTLFKLHLKPILKNSKPHILNSVEKYMVKVSNGRILFFNDATIIQLCKYLPKGRFCYQPTNNWRCEVEFFNGVYSPECLDELPKTNIVTQHDDTTYLTVFEPIEINGNCGSTSYHAIIKTHAIIKNSQKCLWSSQTPKFSYNYLKPNNGVFFEYEDRHKVEEKRKIERINLYIDLSIMIMSIISYLGTLWITIVYYRNKVEREKRRERVSICLADTFSPYARPNQNF